MRRRFNPGWPSTLVLILLFPSLISLGMWQLDRAQQKRALFAEYTRNAELPAITLGEALRVQPLPLGRSVIMDGVFLAPTLLLDNRVRQGQVGYEVLAPFKPSHDATMLVACGWIAAPADRSKLPVLVNLPQAPQSFTGRLGRPPATGIKLNNIQTLERLSTEVIRIQEIDIQVLVKELGHPLTETFVYLNSDLGFGYDRHWTPPSPDVSKHQAYATQWFVMAGVLLLLYLILSFPKHRLAPP